MSEGNGHTHDIPRSVNIRKDAGVSKIDWTKKAVVTKEESDPKDIVITNTK